jgi:hypothetical protein
MEAKKDTLLDHWAMYRVLNREVDYWIRAARSGRKDEARDFLRFCRMAHFVEILKPVSADQPVKIDASNFDCKLRELETWCHPESGNELAKDDIASLHKKIDAIAGELQRLSPTLLALGNALAGAPSGRRTISDQTNSFSRRKRNAPAGKKILSLKVNLSGRRADSHQRRPHGVPGALSFSLPSPMATGMNINQGH